jgi:hypothetical protein
MRRSGVGSGGGIGMNKHRDTRAPKSEPRARSISPGGVNMLGAMQGDHITDRKGSSGYRGEELIRSKGYMPPKGPTDNVAACGVGGGRKVYASGSQDQYGSGGAEKPAGRDILGAFGPESSRAKGE